VRVGSAETAIRRGDPPVWLCTLRLPDGRYIRTATAAIKVATATHADGPYQYDPLLLGVEEFDEEIDVFAVTGAAMLTQARVEMTTTTDLVDLQADWHAVTAATVELAIIWPGQTWASRIVLLAGGLLQEVEFGLAGEPTRFTVEAAAPETSDVVGDSERDLGADFPGAVDVGGTAMTALDGVQYQIVLGDPESVPAYKVGDNGGATNLLILAGHAFPDLGSVEVFEDGSSIGNFTPIVQTSGPSGAYTYVESAVAFDAADGAYTYSASRGGIASGIDASRPALGAGEVLRRLLTDSGLDVDWRRTERAIRLLNGWRVGLFLDEEAVAIDVIHDQLMPWLPIVELSSGDGLWYFYADVHHAPIETDLVVGQQLLGGVGGMRTSDLSEIRNQFSLLYNPLEFFGRYQGSVALGDSRSEICALSQQLYGVRADDQLECPIAWDSATARRILNARASRLALPRRIRTYYASPQLYWLGAGSVVRLTDAEFGVSGDRAVVTSRRLVGDPTITLEMVDRSPFGAL
jgi:hypothetical protein